MSIERKVWELNPSLFHYTNTSGLQGILSKNSLWATHHLYLNDKEEFKTFIRPIVNHIQFPTLPEEEQRIILKKIEGSLLHAINFLTHNCPPYFASFFCVQSNAQHEYKNGRLHLWKKYGKSGYAIEFDTKILDKMLELELPLMARFTTGYPSYLSLATIGYYHKESGERIVRGIDDGTKEDLVREITVLTKMLMETHNQKKKGTLSDKSIDEYYELMMFCAPRIKDYNFFEEDEMRIVASILPNEDINVIQNKVPGLIKKIHSRPNPSKPGESIPYIIFFEKFNDAFKQAVKRIIVGPGSDQKQRETETWSLLKKHGYKNTEVYCSDISYISE